MKHKKFLFVLPFIFVLSACGEKIPAVPENPNDVLSIYEHQVSLYKQTEKYNANENWYHSEFYPADLNKSLTTVFNTEGGILDIFPISCSQAESLNAEPIKNKTEVRKKRTYIEGKLGNSLYWQNDDHCLSYSVDGNSLINSTKDARINFLEKSISKENADSLLPLSLSTNHIEKIWSHYKDKNPILESLTLNSRTNYTTETFAFSFTIANKKYNIKILSKDERALDSQTLDNVIKFQDTNGKQNIFAGHDTNNSSVLYFEFAGFSYHITTDGKLSDNQNEFMEIINKE